MRTISWKHPLIALFAATVVAACSSDSTPGPGTDGGPEASPPTKCGNKKVDTGEDCDGTTTKTCSDATMGKMTMGTLSCNAKTCKFDISKCTGGGGTGGGGGAGGGGGTGGGPGGSGGTKPDGGPDSGPDTGTGGTKPDSGKPDSGKPDATPTPVDAAKG